VLSELPRTDAEFLLARPEFRRFIYVAIQSAGILAQQDIANGHLGRDLSFLEGRRSLGFDLLQIAHAGQPAAIRDADPGAMATLHAALIEALNPPPKENARDRTNDLARYDDLPD
jgi:hypothetical protein